MAFYESLTRGIELEVERPDGQYDHRHLYTIDWDHPGNNDFLVVNQLSVRGRNDRRPDLFRGTAPQDLDSAVRDLVDEAVESEGVFDLFRAAGIDRADISILTDEFLQTFRDQPRQNLRLALLEKLVRDEDPPR